MSVRVLFSICSAAVACFASDFNCISFAAEVANASREFETLPPDLPLPAAAPNGAKWLREATILQPYGHSAFVALANPGERPTDLKEEFGFNVITIQSPDSHNTIAKPADRLSEEQFRTGLATYRAAGYRVILHTSVMALGLSPEFQS